MSTQQDVKNALYAASIGGKAAAQQIDALFKSAGNIGNEIISRIIKNALDSKIANATKGNIAANTQAESNESKGPTFGR